MIQSFPWHVLDAMTRTDVSAIHDVRRWLAGRAPPAQLAAELTQLIGVGVKLRVRRVSTLSNARTFPEGCAVALSGDASGDRAVLLVENALGLSLASFVSGRQAPRFARSDAFSPAVAGAVGAIVAAVGRRICPVPLQVVATGRAADLLPRYAPLHPLAVDATALVGDDAFVVRLVVARPPPTGAAEPVMTPSALAALGPIVLAMPVVAATWLATAAEVGALRVGDVLVLPEWPLIRDGACGWRGRVVIAPDEALTGVAAEFVDGGRLVLLGKARPLSLGTTEMSDAEDREALISAVGDVPVVVRVEIGEARMTARDWATAAAGDVIALGRKVGEPVVLRVGGVAVATGELVQIDDEVGVRIADRLASSVSDHDS
jgi:flagellar motor switch/type III secretory pathway protein FliN